VLPLFKVFIAPEAKQLVEQTLFSGYVAQGPKVDAFEQLLREHFGDERICTVNSCTSAIHLALHLIKREYQLPDGAEVISSPLTCAATNFPVVANRLAIGWADVDPKTLNIDLADVERKLSSQTRILLFVHWGGYPIDYARLAEITAGYRRRFGHELIVVEDCAHAWESYYRGRLVGTVQDNFACFSFQAIKALTTSDGGLLIASSDAMSREARLARWFGLDRDNRLDFRSGQDIVHWGFKLHMNDVAASIGLANYPHVRGLVAKNKENARDYYEELRGVPGLTLPERRDGFDSSYWLFTVLVSDRPNFVRAMEASGIQVNQVHTRNDKYTALAEFRADLPQMDRIADEMICIPVGWWIGDVERRQVIDAIKRGW
jgi:dTDP-4-amino-4,6-dideoxy-D-glucose/dTDP-4-amino-2,4-dideoxy-beta-L-xylose transaminase